MPRTCTHVRTLRRSGRRLLHYHHDTNTIYKEDMLVSKRVAKVVKLQIPAGQAKPGPALASAGIMMPKFCSDLINSGGASSLSMIQPERIASLHARHAERLSSGRMGGAG